MILSTDAIVKDSGLPDEIAPDAAEVAVENLPEEALVFLLASRFCDSDRMLDLAWSLVGAPADCVRFRPRAGGADGVGSLSRRSGRLPRLCAFGRRVLPGVEHSGTLLHRLSRRCRHAATFSAGRFRGLVRGVSRRQMVYF